MAEEEHKKRMEELERMIEEERRRQEEFREHVEQECWSEDVAENVKEEAMKDENDAGENTKWWTKRGEDWIDGRKGRPSEFKVNEIDENVKNEEMHDEVTSEDVTAKQKEKNMDDNTERHIDRKGKGSKRKERTGCEEEEKQKHDVKEKERARKKANKEKRKERKKELKGEKIRRKRERCDVKQKEDKDGGGDESRIQHVQKQSEEKSESCTPNDDPWTEIDKNATTMKVNEERGFKAKNEEELKTSKNTETDYEDCIPMFSYS